MDAKKLYKILIVDDEPIVQVGIKAMLSKGFESFRIVDDASNGREALNKIGLIKPDIVISDIRMPVMSGLELIQNSLEKYGSLPVFIMLTAYEDFDMARSALHNKAVDYIVKIELDKDNLKKALERAVERINELGLTVNPISPSLPVMDEYRQKFMLRLLSRSIDKREALEREIKELDMDLSYNRYIVICGRLGSGTGNKEGRKLDLYSSSLNMVREIIERYSLCYVVSIDISLFAVVFYFDEKIPVADMMKKISDACENAIEMIGDYFGVAVSFGIGTAVNDPMNLSESYEEANDALALTGEDSPVLLFSHIAGSNRRSGKDKLISSIQAYINDNLGGKLQLNDVAESFGLSPAYLSSFFKKNAEIGFSEYVNVRKIEKAKQMLLADDMKIYEVADALSFESAYYFSKVFKKVEGISPREFLQNKTADKK
mgnify:CR=1 FL=1